MAKAPPRRKKVNGYQFIQMEAEWLESPAYRDLKPLARSLLVEFLIIYRPSRNGRLSITTKRAAERLGVTENTAMKAFDDLIEHGFLVLQIGDIWIEKKAREWRLTIMQTNTREPTDDWKLWAPDKPVCLTPRNKKKRVKKLRQTASKSKAALPENLR